MLSVKQMRRQPTSFMASRMFFMPPTVTASAISGFIAVSTESGDAKFHTVVSSSACSRKSFCNATGSLTSTLPMHLCATFCTLLGTNCIRSAAITSAPARFKAVQSRLPTAPAAPTMSAFGMWVGVARIMDC